MLNKFLQFATAVTTAVSALAFNTSVHAQDTRPALWTGAYAGLHIGGASGKISRGSEDMSPLDSVSGAIGGIHAGFNFQSGSVVFGIEADADASGANKEVLTPGGTNLELANTFLGSVRGRIGFTSGAALFYGTGGLAYAMNKIEISRNGFRLAFDDKQTGYVLGLGIEYAFSDKLSGRIEGLHYGFEDSFKELAGSGVHFDIDVIRGGLSYKF
jgi:outer membrane immunogenic protein